MYWMSTPHGDWRVSRLPALRNLNFKDPCWILPVLHLIRPFSLFVVLLLPSKSQTNSTTSKKLSHPTKPANSTHVCLLHLQPIVLPLSSSCFPNYKEVWQGSDISISHRPIDSTSISSSTAIYHPIRFQGDKEWILLRVLGGILTTNCIEIVHKYLSPVDLHSTTHWCNELIFAVKVVSVLPLLLNSTSRISGYGFYSRISTGWWMMMRMEERWCDSGFWGWWYNGCQEAGFVWDVTWMLDMDSQADDDVFGDAWMCKKSGLIVNLGWRRFYTPEGRSSFMTENHNPPPVESGRILRFDWVAIWLR